MRVPCLRFLSFLTLAVFHTTSAALLLSDDFTVSANQHDPNFEIANGRQGGTLATSPYTFGGSQVQVGNDETNVGQPGGASNTHYLLLAFGGWVQNDLAIDDTLAAGGPLTFTFDLYRGSTIGNPDDWMAFSLRAAGSAFPIAGVGEFGMLARNNGGVQMFNGTGVNHNESFFNEGPGYVTSSFWSLTFTDTAGTGSAFAGNGTKVTIYNGATLVGVFDLANQLNSTGLEFGFWGDATMIGGVGNLSITSVPESSQTPLIVAAGLGMLIVTRRLRRQQA